MNVKKILKILFISIVILVVIIKGFGILITLILENDDTKYKIGQIELPNQHTLVKIHADKIALINSDVTVIEGNIENIDWNEDYLLIDIWDKNNVKLKKYMLYNFKTQKIITVLSKNDSILKEAKLSIEEIKPISNYFYETQK